MTKTKNEHSDMLRASSSAFLVEFLKGAVEQENEKQDDVQATVIDAAARFLEEEHASGNVFSMIERVLEPAGNRYLIEAIIEELQVRLPSPAAPEVPQ